MFFVFTLMFWAISLFFSFAWFMLKLMIWLAIAVLVTIARMFPSGRNTRYPRMWWVF